MTIALKSSGPTSSKPDPVLLEAKSDKDIDGYFDKLEIEGFKIPESEKEEAKKQFKKLSQSAHDLLGKDNWWSLAMKVGDEAYKEGFEPSLKAFTPMWDVFTSGKPVTADAIMGAMGPLLDLMGKAGIKPELVIGFMSSLQEFANFMGGVAKEPPGNAGLTSNQTRAGMDGSQEAKPASEKNAANPDKSTPDKLSDNGPLKTGAATGNKGRDGKSVPAVSVVDTQPLQLPGGTPWADAVNATVQLTAKNGARYTLDDLRKAGASISSVDPDTLKGYTANVQKLLADPKMSNQSPADTLANLANAGTSALRGSFGLDPNVPLNMDNARTIFGELSTKFGVMKAYGALTSLQSSGIALQSVAHLVDGAYANAVLVATAEGTTLPPADPSGRTRSRVTFSQPEPAPQSVSATEIAAVAPPAKKPLQMVNGY